MRHALTGAITAILIAGLAVPVTASAAGAAPSAPIAPTAAVAPTAAQVGGSLVTVPARRLVDTRASSGPVRSVLVDTGGRVGTGALAAVLAITVVRPTRSSYLTAYPDGVQPPVALSMSFTAGRTSTNTVVANLSGSARVAVRLAVPANVVVDLLGYFTSRAGAQPAGSYHLVSPKRIVDTRQGLGGRPLTAGGTESVQVAGVAGVPATGVSAVAVNLMTVGSTANGYLTAYPDGQPLPYTASVSFPKGLTIANRAIVGISNGRIRVHNAAPGTTQFVVEIVGYFGSAAGGSYYHPLQNDPSAPPNSPVRVADTRIDPPRNGVLTVSQTALTDVIAGFAPWDSTVPPTAVIASVSVFGERGAGGITAYPTGGAAPATTDLPYSSGQASNQVLAPLARGSFSLRLSGATTQLTVDVTGYFARLRPATATGLWGWGWNSVGRTDLVSSSAPVKIAESTGVIGLSTSGWYANYLVRDDHTVQGWGFGPFGAGRISSQVPVAVPGATGVVAVVANGQDDNKYGTAFALRTNDTVLAWGQNTRGQLADGTTTSRNSVAVIAGLTGITQLAAGSTTGYALKSDGTVWAWGDNAAGQLGPGSISAYRSTPAQIIGLTGIVAIAADQNEAWAIAADGSLRHWGTSYMGQSNAPPAAPSWTAGACPARAIVAADQHGAVLCRDGTVWAWDVLYEPLAHGATIPGLSGVSALSTSETATFALTSTGTVWRWGYGWYNSLGDGYMWSQQAGSDWPDHFTEPAPMPDLAGITMIGSFRQGTFVLR